MELRIHYWYNRDPVELSSLSTVMCTVTAGFHTFLFNPLVSKHTNLKEIILNYWIWNIPSVGGSICKFLLIKPIRCTNYSNLFLEWNYMFRTIPLSIIRSFSLYTQQWYMSYRFADGLRAGSGLNIFPSWSCSQLCSILILLASRQETCMTYTIAACTVKNSWWWTEELSETYRVSFQK